MADLKPYELSVILGNSLKHTFSITVTARDTVSKLKERIFAKKQNRLKGLDEDDVILWKFNNPVPVDKVDETVAALGPLSAVAVEMVSIKPLSDYFSAAPPQRNLHIIAQAPSFTPASERRGWPPGDGPDCEHVSRLRAEREQAFKIAKSKPSPSHVVTPAGLRQAQAVDPILNGRPFSAVGPPITIYEPTFSTFRAMNEGKIYVEVSLKDNALVKALLVASSRIHNTERLRQNAVSEPLERLLGDVFFTTQLDDDTFNGGEIHKTSGENAYLLLLREIKNEAGNGDPSLQAGYAYSRWWSSRLGDYFRQRTCCPSFLLSIAGPWICVQGAILVGKSWIVQPLTDFVWAGTATNIDGQVERIARLLCSLRAAPSALKARFESVKDTPLPSMPPCFPYITSYLDEVTQAKETITYKERLHSEGGESTAIFSGTLGNGQAAFIKFVTRYNAPAHRLLMNEGYAPNLRYCSELANGDTHFMIVMDQIDGYDMHEETFQDEDLVRVREATDLLHKNGYVFGDLRPNNIFKPANGGGVMLVDFDWCGKENEDKYPLVINSTLECWHNDVEGAGTMRKIHDDHLLQKLRTLKSPSQ